MNKSSILLAYGLLVTAVPAEAGQAADIVNPRQTYTYDIMTQDIQTLAARYPGLVTYKPIGETPYHRTLWAVKLGHGETNILINGSHHAREWLTTNLNMYMLDRYADAYQSNSTLDGYPVRDLLDKVAIWFVPMVNPDGVTLQQAGLQAFPPSEHDHLVAMNNGSTDFKHWKANAQGIDLNRQYPADWANIQGNKPAPTWANHKGPAPNTAAEVQALIAFTYEINPQAAVAYHTAGHVLFWWFHNTATNLPRDLSIASQVGRYTGYRLIDPTPNPSGGGYTDWFIQTFGRPGLTPELGDIVADTHLPLSEFSDEWRRNRPVGLYMAQEGFKVWWNSQPTEPFPSSVYLPDTAKLYTHPSLDLGAFASLAPQTVQAFERKGSWYHIHTWAGDKWAYAPDAMKGSPVPFAKPFVLREPVTLHDAPLTHRNTQALLAPQTVQAFERWNDWYHIRTWAGDKWIYVPTPAAQQSWEKIKSWIPYEHE